MLGAPNPVLHRSPSVTDFGDAPVATMIGNGWTERSGGSANYTAVIEASSNSISGKRANLVKTSTSSYKMFSFDRMGTSFADVEVLALLHLIQDPGGTNETTGQVIVRADVAVDSFPADPYYIALPCEVSGVKKSQIGRGNGSGGGVAIGDVNKSWDTTNFWWLRFRVIGTSLKSKMWQYGTAEPTTWENDYTNSNVTAAGYIGLGVFYLDANYACLWFAVATGGNTAPAPGG